VLVASAAALAIGLAVWIAGPVTADEPIPERSDAATVSGDVLYMAFSNPSFDRYTDDRSPVYGRWLDRNVWRMAAFSPYFDDRTSWFPRAWVNRNLYAIYPDSALAREQREWILKDPGGAELFIPWGCRLGTCPQFAADIGNPAFRRYWIDRVKDIVARGYRGIWVDDVNMEFRVGDGNGAFVAPLDPRTGARMTFGDWRRYVAEFVEQIRAELPTIEIAHNAIWFGGGPGRDADPYVARQIRAADYINVERGVNDSGLVGGTGDFSYSTLLSYIDRVHERGRHVVLQSTATETRARDFNLASYFLISTGRDALSVGGVTPADPWNRLDLHLGEAMGPRSRWLGVWRRDFTDGMVLANEPDAPPRTVQLPRTMRDADGALVHSVTLPAASGAVLRDVESQ
jgi:hypothetical protein